MKSFIAEIDIEASPADVWDALTNPEKISRYMYGCKAESGWQNGEDVNFYSFEGGKKTLVVNGKVNEAKFPEVLEHTLFPSASGIEDKEENYIRVRYEIKGTDNGAHLRIIQDGFEGAERGDERLEDVKNGWPKILPLLKGVAEESHQRN